MSRREAAILRKPAGGERDTFRQRARWGWRVLLRGKWLILAIMLLCLAPAVLYIQQARPRFTTMTEILVDAPETGDTLLDRNATPRTRLTDAVIQTEAEVIGSTTLARRVIRKLALDKDPEFNAALRPPGWSAKLIASVMELLPEREAEPVNPVLRARMEEARIVGRLLSQVDIRTQRRSFVIQVYVTAESREKAALIANTIADLYVLERLENSFEETKRVSGWLSERLDRLRQDVATAEAAAETYRAQAGLRRSGERQGTVSAQQLTELNSRLVLARADYAQKAARLEQVRALSRSNRGFETASDVLQAPLIQRLREQEATLQRQLSELSKTLGDRHPQMVGIRADLAELRVKIGQEVEKIAASLSSEVEIASVGVRTLERELDRLRQQTDSAGSAEIRLRELERDAETSRSLYEAFLQRFKRDAEQERIQRANARVLSPAEVPSAPSHPRKRVVLMLALIVGVGAGVVLVFLLDRLDSAVRSSTEAEELTGLPVLAMIPRARRRRGETLEADVVRRPRSALADAVRSLRTALALGDRDKPARVFLVTSSTPKEGKSFVSLCLAMLFARSEQRVLLIDADLHRPRVHAAFGDTGERGLAQVLEGSAGLEEVLLHDEASGLHILPAGRMARGREELANGPEMGRLIAELATRFDRVIVDSPPVLAISDTRMLASAADQVLYLVRWNATPRDAVLNGLKLLGESGANIVGLVLSQVDLRRHARYGYGDYGQYYGRYRDYYAE